MSIGRAFRQALEHAVQITGQTVLVHRNFNTNTAETFEARGLKNSHSKNSRQVIFQFLDQLDIPVGAVLQVKNARDFWRVTDTEDIIQDDVFINLEVHVEKINVEGQVTRPRSSSSTVYNLHGPHSRINIHSQDNSINISHQLTENLFADMRQVIQANIQDKEERDEILQMLEELQAAKGTNNFTDKYQRFIAAAANHMELLAPFIPALTQMLTG